eukprot:scaffold50976_cov20-Tisochrysis_lutea.AAC.3
MPGRWLLGLLLGGGCSAGQRSGWRSGPCVRQQSGACGEQWATICGGCYAEQRSGWQSDPCVQ